MKIEIDDEKRIITIAGIPYSFGLFAAWAEGGLTLDTPFAIQARGTDGIVVIERLDEERAAEIFARLRAEAEA